MVIQLKVTHSKKMRIEIRWQINISWNSWSMLLLTFVNRSAGLTRGNALGHWPVDLPMFMKLLLVYMTWSLHDMGFYMSLCMQSIPSISYLHPTLGVWFAISLYIRGSLTTWRSSSTKNKQRLVTEKKTCNSWNKPGNHMVNWSDWQEELPFFRSSYYTLAIPSKIVKWQVLASQSLYDFLTIQPLRCIIRNRTQLIVFMEEILHQLK